MDHQFLDANNGYVLLYQYNPNDNIPSKIYKTADGGQNWQGFDLPAACIAPQNIHFTNVNTGYIVSNNTSQGVLYKTTDGGQTWVSDFTALANEYFTTPQGVWEYFGTLYMLGNTIISNKLTTSIKGLKKDKPGLKLFPNPSNGIVTLTSTALEKNKQFVVTDIMGRNVHSFEMDMQTSHTIDLTFLNAGIYLLKDEGMLKAFYS